MDGMPGLFHSDGCTSGSVTRLGFACLKFRLSGVGGSTVGVRTETPSGRRSA